jgi:hypothetical protein
MDDQRPPDDPSEVLPPPPIEGWSSVNDAVPPPPAEPSRKRGRILVAGLVAFALLLGGGAAAAFIKMHGSGEQLLSKVPASSDVLFTAYLDPSAGQKANLFLLASRFPALGSEQQIAERFHEQLNDALSSGGLGGVDLSWVGDQVAFALNFPASLEAGASPAFAILVDTDDESAAKATFQHLRDSSSGSFNGGRWIDSTIDGVAVESNPQGAYAVFDGAAVVTSTLDEMADVVATAHGHQAAIEGSSALQAATVGLPEGRLALLFVDPKDLVSLLGQLSADPTADLSTLQAMTGLAMTVSAQPDGIALDMQTVYDPSKLTAEQKAQMDQESHPNPLLSSIPSDALALIQGEHLDTTLKTSAARLEATAPAAARMLTKLGVIGDAGLISALDGDIALAAVPGGTGLDPGASLVLGTKDPVAMQRAFDQIAKGLTSLADETHSTSSGVMVVRSPSRWVTNDYQGVTIHSFIRSGYPDISYAVVDDQGVIGTSAIQVQRVVDTAQGGANISDSSAYRDAIASVPSSDGSVWVDIQGIVDQIRQALPQQQAAFDHDTLPNLAPLKAFVVGSEGDSSHTKVRVFLKIG